MHLQAINKVSRQPKKWLEGYEKNNKAKGRKTTGERSN
ncbi:hypothetical protein NEOC65_000550 [Neochlamydia sp. AcF65]|nr:hypothetical protein [Neochlamydia sp. AcF65]